MKIDKNVVEEDYFDVNLPGHVIEEKILQSVQLKYLLSSCFLWQMSRS